MSDLTFAHSLTHSPVTVAINQRVDCIRHTDYVSTGSDSYHFRAPVTTHTVNNFACLPASFTYNDYESYSNRLTYILLLFYAHLILSLYSTVHTCSCFASRSLSLLLLP